LKEACLEHETSNPQIMTMLEAKAILRRYFIVFDLLKYDWPPNGMAQAQRRGGGDATIIIAPLLETRRIPSAA
jgi:hypothetical protein